ncbi:hypothetical protein K0M31_014366 [Melipona bicolor]|uniref:Uncharacterized protein n=1 Tax=Melipona bicolor TaxID=60889 RepID=A0AA40G8M0_9HYME|nr:hypothetical protein K0M31_014366 [Melipona bicolor]
MTKSTKICIELIFDKSISQSQQIKVKEFWKFMTETKPLEPYRNLSDKKLTKEEDRESFKCKRMWHNQLNVFKERGLDKVALAAVEKSKLCYYHDNYTNPESSSTLEESYDELLNDMKAFDKKSNNKIKTALT